MPRGVMDRDDGCTVEGCNVVFDLINLRANDIARLLGQTGNADIVKKLRNIRPNDFFVGLSPIDVMKYGRSLMATLFVGVVSRVTKCKIRAATVMTGELGLW